MRVAVFAFVILIRLATWPKPRTIHRNGRRPMSPSIMQTGRLILIAGILSSGGGCGHGLSVAIYNASGEPIRIDTGVDSGTVPKDGKWHGRYAENVKLLNQY